jgi:hypothetical protein
MSGIVQTVSLRWRETFMQCRKYFHLSEQCRDIVPAEVGTEEMSDAQ